MAAEVAVRVRGGSEAVVVARVMAVLGVVMARKVAILVAVVVLWEEVFLL